METPFSCFFLLKSFSSRYVTPGRLPRGAANANIRRKARQSQFESQFAFALAKPCEYCRFAISFPHQNRHSLRIFARIELAVANIQVRISMSLGSGFWCMHRSLRTVAVVETTLVKYVLPDTCILLHAICPSATDSILACLLQRFQYEDVTSTTYRRCSGPRICSYSGELLTAAAQVWTKGTYS